MPQVIITLTDTPAGGVSVHSDFRPAIGAKCSLAQSAALDIVIRTCLEMNCRHQTIFARVILCMFHWRAMRLMRETCGAP